MVGLIALYGKPKDERAFLDYYARTHAPLVEKLPALQSYRHGRVSGGNQDHPSHWYVGHLTFADRSALDAALAAPEGTTVVADLANFATGGADVIFVEYGGA